MTDTDNRFFHLDYLPELNESITEARMSSPVPSVTGSYIPKATNVTDSDAKTPNPALPIDSKTYGSAKPRRVVIRGNIIRDQN